ncbi:MAG: FAD-dependent oxidoreductase [Negativicutes bacterium]|nr:FAD-dependent oxidoreductase [Negativicutes bacterium]
MYIIIGQGAAGTTAAKTLREIDPATPVTVITAERDYFYSRIDLPDIIGGKVEPETAVLQTPEAFEAMGVTCLMDTTVKAIHTDSQQVELATGERLNYKKLLLATGSEPVMPRLPGIDAQGVHTLWTMDQARAMIAAAAAAKSAVVVGAGLIGLKTALALTARGLKVTVVERLPRVMPRQLDDAAAAMVSERLAAKNVEVLVDTEVRGIVAADGVVTGVELAGKKLACDMVIMAIGVKPSTALAAAAGLRTGRGIAVDLCQMTSTEGVYAAGDAAETTDALSGEPAVPAIWPAAVEQGRIAAWNMAGSRLEYDGAVAMNSVEVAGMPLVSVGDIEGQAEDEVFISRKGGNYRKIVLRGKVVRGVLCLGDIRQAGAIGGLILRRTELDDPYRLVSPLFSFIDLIAG